MFAYASRNRFQLLRYVLLQSHEGALMVTVINLYIKSLTQTYYVLGKLEPAHLVGR